jgi:hypothetical protein
MLLPKAALAFSPCVGHYCDGDRRLHTRSACVLHSSRISQLAHTEEIERDKKSIKLKCIKVC